MANYTDATKIGQFLQRSLTTNETNSLTGYVLAAIDKWINRKLESNFADVSPSTRYFDGGSHTIDIDPCQSITALASYNNDGTISYSYTENTEWVGEPVNEDVKREIVYRGRRYFPLGQRRMAVSARFTEYDYTNSKVPDDIVLAATRLAGGVLNAGKIAGMGGNIQRENLEGHDVIYDITTNSLEALADSDPIIQGMLGERREILIYDDGNFRGGSQAYSGDDEW